MNAAGLSGAGVPGFRQGLGTYLKSNLHQELTLLLSCHMRLFFFFVLGLTFRIAEFNVSCL